MIGRPNDSRSRAYAMATSRAACARPTATALIPSRPESSAESAIAMPWPGSPTSRSAGRGTSSSRSAAVCEAVRPIFSSGRAALKPGRSGVRWKQETPREPSAAVRRNVV
jgi:hypothetical protein